MNTDTSGIAYLASLAKPERAITQRSLQYRPSVIHLATKAKHAPAPPGSSTTSSRARAEVTPHRPDCQNLNVWCHRTRTPNHRPSRDPRMGCLVIASCRSPGRHAVRVVLVAGQSARQPHGGDRYVGQSGAGQHHEGAAADRAVHCRGVCRHLPCSRLLSPIARCLRVRVPVGLSRGALCGSFSSGPGAN